MIRKFFITAGLALLSLSAFAQTTQKEFLDKYNLLSGKLGVDGVGIETLLGKWEAAYPEDENMLAASFLYYYTKCQNQVTVPKSQSTYLGQKPLLELKDSLGTPVYYFYDTDFDDEMFGKAMQYIDKVNQAKPDILDNRIAAISALVNYEKDSPDMALSNVKELVDYYYTKHPSFTYDDQPVDDETFKTTMQEYCYSFFKLGSPSGYEAFKSLAEKMLQYNANDPLFLDDLGSYYLVGKDDSKTALKYYNNVLKIKPDDLTAIKNCIILARKQKNAKMEKKYLPLMIKYAEDDASKMSAQARLDYLNGKK